MDVIILAAGSSTRMGKLKEKNKVFMNILGHPAIMYPVFLFTQAIKNGEIFIVYKEEQYDFIKDLFSKYKVNVKFVNGGNERFDSVYNALKHVKSDKVLIHDGARVCVDLKVIQNVIDALNDHDAVVPAIKSKNTLKYIEGNFVKETLDRSKVYQIQTPQGFKTSLLIKAIELIKEKGVNITDDASAVEYAGEKVYVVQGNEENLKITSNIDYMLSKAILYKRLNDKKTINFLDTIRR